MKLVNPLRLNRSPGWLSNESRGLWICLQSRWNDEADLDKLCTTAASLKQVGGSSVDTVLHMFPRLRTAAMFPRFMKYRVWPRMNLKGSQRANISQGATPKTLLMVRQGGLLVFLQGGAWHSHRKVYGLCGPLCQDMTVLEAFTEVADSLRSAPFIESTSQLHKQLPLAVRPTMKQLSRRRPLFRR